MVVVLLEVLVADLAYYSYLSLKGARNFSRDLQNTAAVDGSLRVVCEALSRRSLSWSDRQALLDHGVQGFVLGDAEVGVRIEDEGGKLNLNLLAHADWELSEIARQELISLFHAQGQDTALVDRMADFVIAEQLVPETDELYKATPILLLEELLQVEGVTHEFLFGPEYRDAGGTFALARYVTCWGSGRVNINTASRDVLEAVLTGIRPEMAETILNLRASEPFISVHEVTGFFDLTQAQRERLDSRLTAESDTYLVRIACRAGDLYSLTRAVIKAEKDAESSVLLCRRTPGGERTTE
jgi:type II secretory pathway component PulK